MLVLLYTLRQINDVRAPAKQLDLALLAAHLERSFQLRAGVAGVWDPEARVRVLGLPLRLQWNVHDTPHVPVTTFVVDLPPPCKDDDVAVGAQLDDTLFVSRTEGCFQLVGKGPGVRNPLSCAGILGLPLRLPVGRRSRGLQTNGPGVQLSQVGERYSERLGQKLMGNAVGAGGEIHEELAICHTQKAGFEQAIELMCT